MSATRSGRLRRATALVPMALLSAAWTASIAGMGSPVASVAPNLGVVLPDGTSVPAQAIEAPASVSDGGLEAGVSNADAQPIIARSSISEIPSAALAAYQRAETVINTADKGCRLSWQLVAAIGRVESNHGRANGNTLDDGGLATPGIFGVALNGANRTSEIVDTDAGQYDNDTEYDRAVGPMQIIPSTWSVVGVDADGDGVRNPQDVDDAALGTAVYLCSGSDDLATDAGRRAAVYRYNHSQSYVDLVLSIMDAYLAGDFTSIPNGTVVAGQLTKAPPPLHVPGPPHQQQNDGDAQIVQPSDHGGEQAGDPPATDDDTPDTAPPPSPSPSPPDNDNDNDNDSDNDSNGDNDGGGDGGDQGGNGNPGGGVDVPDTNVSIPPLPTADVEPVDQILTVAQATAQCTREGLDQVLQPQAFQQCLNDYTS